MLKLIGGTVVIVGGVYFAYRLITAADGGDEIIAATKGLLHNSFLSFQEGYRNALEA